MMVAIVDAIAPPSMANLAQRVGLKPTARLPVQGFRDSAQRKGRLSDSRRAPRLAFKSYPRNQRYLHLDHGYKPDKKPFCFPAFFISYVAFMSRRCKQLARGYGHFS
jgi:hypothetical protein